MANTQAISGVMKQVALGLVVDSKALKGALYLVSATTNGSNTVYTCAAPFGSQLIRVGQTVQFSTNSSTYTYRGSAPVVAVDYANATFSVLTTNVPTSTPITSDFVFPEGLFAVAPGTAGIVALPSFIYGLPYHHNDATTGTWLTLNRPDFPELVTPSVNANSGSLTTTQPQVLLAKIEMALGQQALDGAKLFWYLHPKQHVAYVQLAQLISEVTLGSNGNNGAVDVLHSRKDMRKMCGIEVFPSINADPTRIDLIDGNNWIRGTYLDTQVMTMAGMTKLPVYGATGGFGGAELFYIGQASNFATKNPRKGGYIKSLAVPSFA